LTSRVRSFPIKRVWAERLRDVPAASGTPDTAAAIVSGLGKSLGQNQAILIHFSGGAAYDVISPVPGENGRTARHVCASFSERHHPSIRANRARNPPAGRMATHFSGRCGLQKRRHCIEIQETIDKTEETPWKLTY
jgi:hypothetical protein